MPHTGTVSQYNQHHRCGVIASDDYRIDLRVDSSDLDASGLDHLTRNCKVSFEPALDREGRLHAQRITQLQDPRVAATHTPRLSRIQSAGFRSIF